jgi:HSP20 family protein
MDRADARSRRTRMSTTRDPLRDLLQLRERVNQLFNETLSTESSLERESPSGSWSPPVDIQETPERFVLRADLPGLSVEQIELRIENDRLSIKGDRPFATAARREDFHRIERNYGRFSRSFALPRSLNHSEVRAELKNGVLEVVLPKKAETQARQIRVETR